MSNFIKSVSFSGLGKSKLNQRKITFSFPNDINKNTLTILCGKNRTGKSYILHHINKCVSKHNKNIEFGNQYTGQEIQDDDIAIEIVNLAEKINDFFLINNINHLSKIATTISISKNTKFKKRGHPSQRTGGNNEIPFKIYLDDFAKESISYISGCFDKQFDNDKWEEDEDNYRIGLASSFEKNILYKLNEKDDLVSFFYAATGGYLYINNNKSNEGCTFDIYLVYSENIISHYNNWSDGQKILFICLVIIKYSKPKIFLFDEIENHLHPEFISILLEYLKSNVPQTIITTHHPHIIFSNHVDSVWYLELENPQNDLPEKLNRIDKNLIKPPVRKAIELEKNYDKLVSTYKLFDNYDNQLIRLSSSTISDLNEKIVEIFTKLFYYEVIPSNPKKKNDLQVDGLLKHLIEKIEKDREIQVLEIGAGKGRILLDLAKLEKEPLARNVVWNLYEPFENVRLELEKTISSLRGKYKINILSEIEKSNKFDLIFVANVIHELNPIDLSNVIHTIQGAIKNDGELIIIELFPLLSPEKLSVPYKSEELLYLFRLLSWRGKVEKINFKYASIEAYWLCLHPNWNTAALSQTEILKIISKYWRNELLKTRCQDYNGKRRLKGTEEIVEIMCELTSIASISCYDSGEWKSFNNNSPEDGNNIIIKETKDLISKGKVEQSLSHAIQIFEQEGYSIKDLILLQCRYYINKSRRLLGLEYEENFEIKISDSLLEIINQNKHR
ncbi:MAG TPA: AAA family ATPase [Haliscomenobacter sp.]|uniref:AAA family ATPase n=1 Tax=Haliscomenobacter sp. TaxID=2717303 RepID=UPI002B5CC761|nr:AAA family ATPase [Haliscomenobacter sp.]HOY18422.1 AAA family ATPase [Haliscomenobacter sp.]